MKTSKTRITIVAGVSLSLIPALAILVLIGWMTYRDVLAARAAAKVVDRTYSVLQKLDEVFSALKDAEAGQRGYVITGKKEYLEPYDKATNDINLRLSSLRGLIQGNPRQQRSLDSIELAMRKKLAALKDTIETRRTKGYRDAGRIIESGIGEKLMDDIRIRIAGARDEETRLLNERSAARRLASDRLVAAILTGGLLSLMLLLTAFYFLRNEIVRRMRVEEELRRHQEDLEILVTERTRELASANCQLKEEIAMRGRAEKELRKTMEELARSNRELDQFASIASHDLQSPLRAVAGFLELLSRRYEGKLDGKAEGYIARALNGTKRMSALVHDLYAYARAGTQGKAPAPIDLGATLRGAIDNLRENIDENGAALTWDELPCVEGDDTQLLQLFQNLIANAIKYRKRDTPPAIRVSAEQRQGEWIFGVHDNGIGIEPRFYERVFVMFQRLHSYDAYPGTGLGLALCRRIVERHGGRIWIESRPGEGSSFYFTIPVSRAGAEAKEAGRAC